MVIASDPNARPVISFQHVWKRYPNGTDALQDVSLTVPDGDFLFLVGPSGAGKSTVVRLLIREEKATRGKIFVHGMELGRMKRWRLPYFRRRIGLVFQDFKLLPRLTVYENVSYALRVMGDAERRIQPRVEMALDTVGLSHKHVKYPDELSGGEKQGVT